MSTRGNRRAPPWPNRREGNADISVVQSQTRNLQIQSVHILASGKRCPKYWDSLGESQVEQNRCRWVGLPGANVNGLFRHTLQVLKKPFRPTVPFPFSRKSWSELSTHKSLATVGIGDIPVFKTSNENLCHSGRMQGSERQVNRTGVHFWLHDRRPIWL